MPKKNTIKLFYLGGLGENPDPKFRTPLNVSGSEFTLPPVYGYIEVTPRTANRIMSKWKISNKEGTFDAFTTDPRIMRQIKAGQRTVGGDMNIPPKERYTVDELQKMLEEAQLDELTLKADEAEDEPVVVKDEPSPVADIPLPVVDEPSPTKQEKPTQTKKPVTVKPGNKSAKGNK